MEFGFREYLLTEETATQVDDLQKEEDFDLVKEAECVVDCYLNAASKKYFDSGEYHWRNQNHKHWAEHKDDLVKKVINYIHKLYRIAEHKAISLTTRRKQCRDFLDFVFQKDVGFGSRRHAERAHKMGADPTKVLHPEHKHRHLYARKRGRPKNGL